MDIATIRGALARGYCADGQTHKVLDPDLCEAQAQDLLALVTRQRRIQVSDVAFLLSCLDYLSEVTGETLDPEDMAIIADIRADNK